MLLKNGSKGSDVAKLQNKLGLKADGIFGPATEASVRKYQKENGLVADGIVGMKTWNMMFPNSNAFNIEAAKPLIPAKVYEELVGLYKKYGITSKLRLAHFLSQCAHESGNFTRVRENLNYSYERLIEIFRYRLDTNRDGKLSKSELDFARSIANNPREIGNFVYANRMGNHRENGFEMRGRGFLQTTGVDNVREFGNHIGYDLVSNPDLIATKFPLESAAFFFSKNNLWKICDKGSSTAVITELTRRINGSTNGLIDRINKFNYYYSRL